MTAKKQRQCCQLESCAWISHSPSNNTMVCDTTKIKMTLDPAPGLHLLIIGDGG